MTWFRVYNRTHPLERGLWVRLCDTWWCRLRGLMFRRGLRPDEGLLFTWPRAGRWQAAVHMWGMFFPLALVWLNGDLQVVDVRSARPWRTVAVPREPARYLLELPLPWRQAFAIGHRLALEPETPPWLAPRA